MREDYLWDRSGPPDPEIERLETLLRPLGHGRGAAKPLPLPRRPWRAMAAAAAVVLAAGLLLQFRMAAPGPATGWAVARVEGSARMGADAAAVAMPLRAGLALRTGESSELTLQNDNLGRIDLGPRSEIQATDHRQVELRRGRLHAFIWAPPREFVVDTPSARAVDLGCEYTIDVDPAGDGLLKVSMGWVAFQFQGRDSFIPAGAQCMTRRRAGPGIPYFDDARPELRQAVGSFERGERAALPRILASARPRDGLTLWHLLTRVGPGERGAVFDRFAALVSLPPEVSRDAVLRGDAASIDLCWNALELQNTGWWRGWERNWVR